jgi:hypothetical protein
MCVKWHFVFVYGWEKREREERAERRLYCFHVRSGARSRGVEDVLIIFSKLFDSNLTTDERIE